MLFGMLDPVALRPRFSPGLPLSIIPFNFLIASFVSSSLLELLFASEQNLSFNERVVQRKL